MEATEASESSGDRYDPANDIQLQALRYVDEVVKSDSSEVVDARLWALFWATTARLRYRGAPRSGFAAAFDQGCRTAELALRQDIEEARSRMQSGAARLGVVAHPEAPQRLM